MKNPEKTGGHLTFRMMAHNVCICLWAAFVLAITGYSRAKIETWANKYKNPDKISSEHSRDALSDDKDHVIEATVKPGDHYCDSSSKVLWTKEDPADPTAYFYCSPKGKVERANCPTVRDEVRVFDKYTSSCHQASGVFRSVRGKRQLIMGQQLPSSAAEAQRVGDVCRFNTDCISGAYCENGVCGCLAKHIAIDTYCWKKINPDEAGCQYPQQCNAVWPGATCSSSGICRCPFDIAPVQTRDGPVCATPGECPTNGLNTRFRDYGEEVPCVVQASEVISTFCGGWGDMYICVGQMCCPSRALTCIQPMDMGQSSSSQSTGARWFYNTITHNCQQFTYLGSGGNANNFLTEEHCESYCKTVCPRGDPEYHPALLETNVNAVRTCSDGGCGSNFQCIAEGGQSLCCPTNNFICSAMGGVPTPTLTIDAYSPGIPAVNSTVAIPRYYWDQGQRRCAPFMFFGQAGNYNNFGTEAECQAFCSSTLCTRGEPLKSNGNQVIMCTAGSQCPTTHYCISGSCCPTQQTVCTQPRAVGSCSNYVQRFWYNSVTGACEVFTYSGCSGNANNFGTFMDCANFCRNVKKEPKCIQGIAYKDQNGNFYECGTAASACPNNYECYFDGNVYGCCPTRSSVCSSSADAGVGCISGVPSNRWFYDAGRGICATFAYRGCDGNANNFAIQRDCEDFCGVGGCPDGGSPMRDRPCNQPGTLPCPNTHVCTQIEVGFAGAGLTASATSYCCPTKATICAQAAEEGNVCGSAVFQRYFYDVQTRTCRTFNFNGCGGNRNNFQSAQQCLNFCNSAACPSGQVAYASPEGGGLQSCSPGVYSSCPTGYVCHFDPLTTTYVCCGTPDTHACPVGENPFVDAMSQAPWQCTPNSASACPNNYLCRYSAERGLYYCCQPASLQGVCPFGSTAYVDSLTNQVRACVLETVGVCPQGYSCRQAASGATFGYCCSNAADSVSLQGPPFPTPLPGICSAGAPYLVGYNQPVVCIQGTLNSCPVPFVCQQSIYGMAFCCTNPLVQQPQGICPFGQPAMQNGQPQSCSPSTANCPPQHSCAFSPGSSQWVCCSGIRGGPPPTSASVCPGGAQPAIFNGLPQTCRGLSSSECPAGYRCMDADPTQLRQQKVCCSGGGIAGVPQVPFLTSSSSQLACPLPLRATILPQTGQPQSCQPGFNSSCPANSQCFASVAAQGFLCCGAPANLIVHSPTRSGPSFCPGSGEPARMPGTPLPLACQTGVSTCPSGFACTHNPTIQQGICCPVAPTRPDPLEILPDIDLMLQEPAALATARRRPVSSSHVLINKLFPCERGRVPAADGTCLHELAPGEPGCIEDVQCETYAHHGKCNTLFKCRCGGGRMAFNRTCIESCPANYNDIDGLCVSPTDELHLLASIVK